VTLGARAGRACALPYSQSMKTLGTHVLQAIASSAVECWIFIQNAKPKPYLLLHYEQFFKYHQSC
jgi:hypothetical protein